MISIFKNLWDKENPHHITVDLALQRIKTGKSKETVEKIRLENDKDKQDALKAKLPCVCFSGTFSKRFDRDLIEHSGYIILDFDDVDVQETMSEMCGFDFVKAAWVSPRANGVKVLCVVSNPSKHREHFGAFLKRFKIDKSGVNESRVCYESYDPNIYINPNPVPFTELVENEVVQSQSTDIQKLVSWLAKDSKHFVQGERNKFIFTLACACCRYGIDIEETQSFCYYEFYQNSTDFSKREGDKAIESAYRTEKKNFGTVSFSKGELVDSKGVKAEFEIKEGDRIKDVIYYDDADSDVDDIIENGYKNILGIGVPLMDYAFKEKRGQTNLVTGYGNHGKSTFYKWYLVFRAVLFGEKTVFFAPEEDGAEGFYLSIMEIYLGGGLAKNQKYSKDEIKEAKQFAKNHFFFIYPEEVNPTPQYIKERFMYLMITEKADRLVIDPFNQMYNDYKLAGGRDDKYLELVLGDFNRFTRDNDIFFTIIAHPKTPQKNKEGGYDAPTEYDLAQGAMWNNKMHNILAYHRPEAWKDPQSSECELHSRKVKLNKINGNRGMISFEYDFAKRRFLFDGRDYMEAHRKLAITEAKVEVSQTANISNFESEVKASESKLPEVKSLETIISLPHSEYYSESHSEFSDIPF